MSNKNLQEILSNIAAGKISISAAEELIKKLSFEELEFARIDHQRSDRCGFPEVIFAAGKDLEQVITIAEKIIEKKETLFITRLDEDKYQGLKTKIPQLTYNKKAKTASLLTKEAKKDCGLLIVTAGTSDIAVAEEAATTCEALGFLPEKIYDVGVAGIHRLLADSDRLHNAKVIIVVAGMEGALPSVVAGMVSAPVIAVPTSVGYGAAFGGIAALLGMLNACSSGVTVCNIDNGFGAGVAAVRILNTYDKDKE